jgi:Flp pilus assembly protein TadB
MENSVYTLNKGINQPIEFKGLKAQYIWYLGVGLLALLLLFVVLYIVLGLNAFVCAGLILVAGTGFILWIYHLSHHYGRHGLMKTLARRYVPPIIKSYSRSIFLLNS